ncbi:MULTISPECIES: hypothetical protein [Vibrio]|uniref:Uncharacterized protein n=1 Tax=Vibrio campbellii TaxID=680 RepID=A0AAQ2Y2C5_9VIBR|nr:hypothetical protein [Vibrio campbellii]WDG10211.1 hypothetical protein PUN50_22820 [Vibrio campbellii]
MKMTPELFNRAVYNSAFGAFVLVGPPTFEQLQERKLFVLRFEIAMSKAIYG